MDKRLQYIYENFDKLKIGVDDTFNFRCTMCGNCCRDREDILLSPVDIFNLAKHFNKQPFEIIKSYCEVYIGNSSKMPIVRLLPIGIDKRCPFLKGNRCSVHNSKPNVCALFPLGRSIQLDAKGQSSPSITYILQKVPCGDKRQTHTVRQWLKDAGLPIQDLKFIIWNQAISSLSAKFHEFQKYLSNKELKEIWDYVFVTLYIDYNVDKKFFPQLKSNLKIVTSKVQSFYDQLMKVVKQQD